MTDIDEYATRDSKDETVTMAYKPEYPSNTAVYTKQGWCYYVDLSYNEAYDMIMTCVNVDRQFASFDVLGSDTRRVMLRVDEIVSVVDLTPEDAK